MDFDEEKLLKEICRRVEALLSDAGLAASAQWRQAVADSADGAGALGWARALRSPHARTDHGGHGT